jgi:hypothetical protein
MLRPSLGSDISTGKCKHLIARNARGDPLLFGSLVHSVYRPVHWPTINQYLRPNSPYVVPVRGVEPLPAHCDPSRVAFQDNERRREEVRSGLLSKTIIDGETTECAKKKTPPFTVGVFRRGENAPLRLRSFKLTNLS